MKNTGLFQPFFDQQGVVVLPGGLATELEARGAVLRDALWSARLLLDSPEKIRQVHLDYFLAGADVAISASYQASFEGFVRFGISRKKAVAMLQLSVGLAREARDIFWADRSNRQGRLRPLVAASVGPYGAFLADGSEYRGKYGLSLDELINFHRPRMEVLASSGADLLACETIPSRLEGEALARLLEEFPEMPAWISFSCCDADRVCGGDLFPDSISAVAAFPQVAALGVNCTPPQWITSLLHQAKPVTAKPLVVYPNSGESWDAVRRCWVSGGVPVPFDKLALEWFAAGARLIGGCCRTGPQEIRTIRTALINPEQ